MMSEEVSTIPTTQVVTPELVVASINRARRSLEAAAEEIVWQIEMEAWVTLGYKSWDQMRDAEYGGAAFMVPSKSRPEIVARIKEIEVGRTARGNSKHLTDQEIANTAGVSRTQVHYDLHGRPDEKFTSEQDVTTTDDIIDAEIVEIADPQKERDAALVNDIRLYLRHIGTSKQTTRLSPKAKQHIINALSETITQLQRS